MGDRQTECEEDSNPLRSLSFLLKVTEILYEETLEKLYKNDIQQRVGQKKHCDWLRRILRHTKQTVRHG